jgi:histidine triad (HIT) family protein
MASVFTRIINGEIPSHKIAENENYFAFLDINPLAMGHTLVIPKKETDYLFDLDDELYAGLMLFAKKIAAAVEKSVTCKRIGVAVIGLEVPHAHIHLVPLNTMRDINFSLPKMNPTQDELKEMAEKIKSNL